jgi:alpha-galactosidase
MSKIVLVGAGSAMFGLGALGDIFKSHALKGSTISLVDINSNTLSEVAKTAADYIAEHHLSYTIEATTDRKEALKGAGYVIISIEVGNRYELWEQDWHIPQQFGIKQVYGENGGPGGVFHALRIIPPILDICADINRICPEALVINLSNPMTTISMAIKKKFPQMKLIGLCHEISSLVIHLPKMLNTDFDALKIRAGGLNHFSILLEASYRDSGKDAYPEIRKMVPEHFGKTSERGLFMKLFDYFGYVPITTDSHLGEYVSWAQEVADHKGIIDFYTGYKKECLSYVVNPQKRISEGTQPEEYWRVIPIIEGIETDDKHEELAVNMLNNGLIANLPEHVIVEVPAYVDKDGVHGMKLDMPAGFGALLSNRVGVLDMTVEAAITGSKRAALQALLVDPVVDSVYAAEKTLDTILSFQTAYLGYLK